MTPQIEKAHPSGVKSNEYLSDRPPIVFLKMEKPKISSIKRKNILKQISKCFFLLLPELINYS